MEYVDVIFPQKVGVLTYSVPPRLRGELRPGMTVEAELRKTRKKGILLGPARKRPVKAIKPLAGACPEAPALSPSMLRLITWMAEYYISPEGVVLKSVLTREFFERVKARKSRKGPPPPSPVMVPEQPYGLDASALERVRDHTLGSGGYKTFLLHSPGTRYEMEFAAAAVKGTRGGTMIRCPPTRCQGRSDRASRDVTH